MSQDTEQKIRQVSEGLNGPVSICRELNAKHPGYLDLFLNAGISGGPVYGLWVFCGEDTDNLIDLLEAHRNGRVNLVHAAAATRSASIQKRYRIDFDTLIAYGKALPRSKRLA